jgi:hypothetical protein
MSAARDLWLLPEDGIIDPVAVEIAATGKRPVRLTASERREAAAMILAEGGSPWLISKRLKISTSIARTLAAEIAEAAAREVPESESG